mmetsp:Transcript_18443/g.46912  ORF Transcript_18443/g.46912 Transcript_18443/m.46912 type:complete len:444 (-) Transcript_18443:752-2083(-)
MKLSFLSLTPSLTHTLPFSPFVSVQHGGTRTAQLGETARSVGHVVLVVDAVLLHQVAFDVGGLLGEERLVGPTRCRLTQEEMRTEIGDELGQRDVLLDQLLAGAGHQLDGVAGAGPIVDALVVDATVSAHLGDGERRRHGGAGTHQEGARLLLAQQILYLLPLGVTEEPRRAQSLLHTGDERPIERTEPAQHLSEASHTHHIGGIAQTLIDLLYGHDCLQRAPLKLFRIAYRRTQCRRQLGKKLSPFDVFLSNKVVLPERSTSSIGDRCVNDHHIQHGNDLCKTGALCWLAMPTHLHEVCKRRNRVCWNRGSSMGPTDGTLELTIGLKLRKRFLFGDNLPQHNCVAIHVALFIKRFAEEHFRSHPQRSARDRVLVLQIVGLLDCRQAKITHFAIQVTINQNVGWFEISMNNGRVGTMKPVHAQRDLFAHQETLTQRDVVLGIV